MGSGNGKPRVRGSADELHRRLDLMGAWAMGQEKRKHLECRDHLREGMEAGMSQLQSRLG